MAESDNKNSSSPIDPKSGFNPETKIFHSLRPTVRLPPPHLSISAAEHAFSLLQTSSSTLETTAALISATTGIRITYSDFLRRVESLSSSLRSEIGLSRGDVAFILSPTCLQIPILYFSLLSLGVIIAPANPLSSPSEISRQIHLSNPTVAFASAATAHKLSSLRFSKLILLDSSHFHSMMTTTTTRFPSGLSRVHQSDSAAILYSSGTTGRVKGVELTHRNFIVALSAAATRDATNVGNNKVSLVTVPVFHSFGMAACLLGVGLGTTMVLMEERFDLEGMLKAAETYRVTSIPVAPPVVVAMAKAEVVENYDLSELRTVICAGAPLGKDVSERFAVLFPHVLLLQVLYVRSPLR